MAFTDRLANRGSVSTGYDIEHSVMLDGAGPDEMHFTTDNSSSDHDKGTFSFWWKRGLRGHISPMQINDFAAPYHAGMYWQSGTGNLADRLFMDHKDNTSNWTSWMRQFRDHAAWYHFVVRVDTTLQTADDRIQLWINGVRETTFNTLDSYNSPPSQNDAHFWFDTGRKMTVGGVSSGDCYYADYNYIDGQSVAPTEFGEVDEDSGIWKPKKYGGTYGNNGFHLEFKGTGTNADSSGIGADTSGNGHHMTLINVDTSNKATDTPTNNFTTWQNNVLFNVESDNVTLYDGNTRLTRAGGTGWTTAYNTMAPSAGKWYFEVLVPETDIKNAVGVTPRSKVNVTDRNNYYLGQTSGDGTVGKHFDGGSVYQNGSGTSSTDIAEDDIIGVAMDLDNNKVHFSVNNSWTNSSDPANNTNGFSLLDEPYFFGYTTYDPNKTNHKTNLGGYTTMTVSSAENDANGYGNFEYAPPSGYYALCTKNLAEYGG